MPKIVPTFTTTTSLTEIVEQTNSPICFFHKHNHKASYQILADLMPTLYEIGVRRFFLEITESCNARLEEHFQTKSLKTLTEISQRLLEPTARKGIDLLVSKAHAAGIRIIGVDEEKFLSIGIGVGNDLSKVTDVMNLRRSGELDQTMIDKIQKTVGVDEKFAGLFGLNHIEVGVRLDALSVLFQPGSVEQTPLHPSQIECDAKSRQLLEKCDIIFMAPTDLHAGEIDFSSETNPKILLQLNQFLKKLGLPECKAYYRENGMDIDAIALVPKADYEIVWNRAVAVLDPFAKLIEKHDETTMRLVIQNIHEAHTVRLIISSLLAINKK